jgi:DtxR family Mn-dependent transcriptional regulator
MSQRPPSIAREDYLQTILQLDEEDIPVIRARLAERLEVSAPSVSEAIRSLETDGLVELEDNRRIILTPAGRRMAENIVRRHRVAERILTDLLGLPWHEAHAEAHRLEHGLSDHVVDAALAVLGHPTTCPHGSPIPGSTYEAPDAVPIADVGTGHRFRLVRIAEEMEFHPEILAYLGSHGFTPGISGQVKSVSPDGTISVDAGGEVIAIGPPATAQIFVTVD